jgi:hypothetical protein
MSEQKYSDKEAFEALKEVLFEKVHTPIGIIICLLIILMSNIFIVKLLGSIGLLCFGLAVGGNTEKKLRDKRIGDEDI